MLADCSLIAYSSNTFSNYFAVFVRCYSPHARPTRLTSRGDVVDRRASEEPRSRRVNDIMIMMKKKVDVDALWTKNNSNLLLESIQSFREG